MLFFDIINGKNNENLSNEEKNKRLDALKALFTVGTSVLRERATEENGYAAFADFVESYSEIKKKESISSSDRKK